MTPPQPTQAAGTKRWENGCVKQSDWDEKMARLHTAAHQVQLAKDSFEATAEEVASTIDASQSHAAVSGADQVRLVTMQRLAELEHVLDLVEGAEGTEEVRREIEQMRARLRSELKH
jgi:hypothetical protein